MYINRIVVFCLLLVQFNLNGQERSASLKIQEITFENVEFLKQVTNFIDSLNDHDDHWKNGKGYLRIVIGQIDDKRIKSKYLIFPDLREIKKGEYFNFPLFFSYISGRIAVIDLGNDFHLKIGNIASMKSQRKFLRLLEPFLYERSRVVLRDMNGEVIGEDKNFRGQYLIYTETSGIEIIFYDDGSMTVKRTNYRSK
uniref:hypothetical protein n=1 Tax=Roseivirga sp. TaxID=1964215 RepID=UPI0040489F47